MRVLAIAIANLRRLFRDRSNIFFVFILPLAIILLIGAQFGGDVPAVVWAVSGGDSEFRTAVVAELEAAPESRVELLATEEEMVARVERGAVSGGIAIPAGIDQAIDAGETPSVGFVARPGDGGRLWPTVENAVSGATSSARVARVLATETGIGSAEAEDAAAAVQVPGLEITSRTVGDSIFPTGLGRFDVGAAQELVLFVFLTALTGSAAIIQSRQLGVTRRMLSTPTSPATVVAGEGAGRFATGLVQGIYIVVVTLVGFGVDWGDMTGVVAVLVALAAVGAGAAMLLGTLFRNDQQASGVSVMLGLGLAALGGCMLPMELFSPTMVKIAHFTPHAWAIDGFAKLVYHGGSLVDVLPEVGVLLGFAAVLLVVSSWRLRSVITRP